MYFKQFYLNCLAHASYLVCSNGEAVVVDPQRDVEQYLTEAETQNATIKYIFETHLHADFVSGHCELAERTGAEIVYGARAAVDFPHRSAHHDETFHVGALKLTVFETPGHTLEGICIFIESQNSTAAPKLLTGDTLFIGDVGRPDLAGLKGHTPQEMAGMMYDSLHNTILKLNDEVQVYPAHGAGSLCGKNLSIETSSTIGQQKQLNYALKPMCRDEFIRIITTELPDLPQYFPRDAEINRIGARRLSKLLSVTPLTPQQCSQQLNDSGIVVLDVRSPENYGGGHVPGAINVGLDGQFASWAGTLFPLETSFLIVAENENRVREAVTRLARVGMERNAGFLAGGMDAWLGVGFSTNRIEQISVTELNHRRKQQELLQLIDVRRSIEYRSGHVPGAQLATLAQIDTLADNFDCNRPTAVICAGGYRSSIATGFLARHGFRQLSNVTGGTAAWISAQIPIEN
jgi:glyoxylase-like metal-dependent hydrolase (beta-lactamase superfamily II)/rhodanese-related sulfurtransferase